MSVLLLIEPRTTFIDSLRWPHMTGHFTAMIDDALLRWRDARRRVLRRKAGISAVHEWRISTRRLFALEELLAPRAALDRDKTLRLALHQAFRATGHLRDNQVSIRELERLAPRFPAATRLARHLRDRLPKRRRRVIARVHAVKPRALRRITSTWGDQSAQDFERVARSRAARRLARADRLMRTVVHHGDAASIHALRIRLKLLRYMTELCDVDGHARRPAHSPTRLVRGQAQLGRITDLQVLLDRIDRYGHRHRRWRLEASSLRHHLERRRLRLLEVMNAGKGARDEKFPLHIR